MKINGQTQLSNSQTDCFSLYKGYGWEKKEQLFICITMFMSYKNEKKIIKIYNWCIDCVAKMFDNLQHISNFPNNLVIKFIFIT